MSFLISHTTSNMSDLPTKQKLWGGRFTGKTDPLYVFRVALWGYGANEVWSRMNEFNQSLRYDKRMHAVDIAGSIAYAKALEKVGILTTDEQSKIVSGLQKVGQEWVNGTVCYLGSYPKAVVN